jgi:hypothetical protein
VLVIFHICADACKCIPVACTGSCQVRRPITDLTDAARWFAAVVRYSCCTPRTLRTGIHEWDRSGAVGGISGNHPRWRSLLVRAHVGVGSTLQWAPGAVPQGRKARGRAPALTLREARDGTGTAGAAISLTSSPYQPKGSSGRVGPQGTCQIVRDQKDTKPPLTRKPGGGGFRRQHQAKTQRAANSKAALCSQRPGPPRAPGLGQQNPRMRPSQGSHPAAIGTGAQSPSPGQSRREQYEGREVVKTTPSVHRSTTHADHTSPPHTPTARRAHPDGPIHPWPVCAPAEHSNVHFSSHIHAGPRVGRPPAV